MGVSAPTLRRLRALIAVGALGLAAQAPVPACEAEPPADLPPSGEDGEVVAGEGEGPGSGPAEVCPPPAEEPVGEPPAEDPPPVDLDACPRCGRG